MCGIAGVFGAHGLESLEGMAGRMAQTMTHRGPDSSGVWSDSGHGIALSHRRLAVLDLSAAGHQPMTSCNGRFTVSYNGEIYNHFEIRKELEQSSPGIVWRGQSDTETLVESLACWGVAGTLKKLNGMFAFAAWDARECKLSLARDQAGEKPLYYGTIGNLFFFSSEMKAFQAIPGWGDKIDKSALDFYMRFSYVPAPLSIFKNIRKVQAGHLVEIDDSGRRVSQQFKYIQQSPLHDNGADDQVSVLERLLRDCIRRQMISDVPLGALLSGGVDSTVVVALMQSLADCPVKTFTIGFHEKEFNEAPHAKEVARYLATDHHEMILQPRDALEIIPRLPEIWDEPFADPSQIATFAVSRFTRQHVTVALSGDGGDELFAGYERYSIATKIHGILGALPTALRLSLAGGTRVAAAVSRTLGPDALRATERLFRLSEVIGFRDLPMFCNAMEALYLGKRSLVRDFPTEIQNGARSDLCSVAEAMMELDLRRYLPENILAKTDRASMANSLELRAPLLDSAVVSFAAHLPMDFKIRNGETKWLLKQVLYRHVPQSLVDRPKAGFSVPIEAWLDGPLRDWAEDLLSVESLERPGCLDVQLIRDLWQEYKTKQRKRQRVIWNVLMFQAWWRLRGADMTKTNGRNQACD